MSNILTGILNEANPYRISEPEREYGAPAQSRPRMGPQEPEDVPDDMPPEDPFKQDPAKLAKVDFSKAEGEAPNGKRYNMIMTVTGPAHSVRGEVDMFDKHNWGAKKIVDTTTIEAKTPNGPSQYTVYIVDNHKYGLWTPFKGEKPIGEPLVFKESQDGISASDLADILYNRLEMRYPDIVSRYGHDVVGDVVMDVADFHEGAEELGTSDIGGMIRQIVNKLENYNVDESKEQDYGPDYQAMVNRVGQLAKQGERKTVYDPVKRVYKTVPVNPPKQQGVAEGSLNEKITVNQDGTTVGGVTNWQQRPDQEYSDSVNQAARDRFEKPSASPKKKLEVGDIIGIRPRGAKMMPIKAKVLEVGEDSAKVKIFSPKTIASQGGNDTMTISTTGSVDIQNPYGQVATKPLPHPDLPANMVRKDVEEGTRDPQWEEVSDPNDPLYGKRDELGNKYPERSYRVAQARKLKQHWLSEEAQLGALLVEVFFATDNNVVMSLDQILDYIEAKIDDPNLTALEYMYDNNIKTENLITGIMRRMAVFGIKKLDIFNLIKSSKSGASNTKQFGQKLISNIKDSGVIDVHAKVVGEASEPTSYIQVKQLIDKMDKGGKKRIANALRKNLGITTQGVAEGFNNYLWHGSKTKHSVLYPQQADDTGGKEESNKNAVYATPIAKVAIAMGLTIPGSDTGMFPNDPQMVLFKGGIRKGQMVYLHKVPKDLFIKHNDREWYSKPGVKEVKPIEVVAVPVDKWLHLIRQATPQDLELQKKNLKKQGVAEGSEQINELRDRMYQYIRSIVPTWPEYVVQDWLYKGRGKNKNYNVNSDVKGEILEMIAGAGLSPNTNPWQLVPNMKFTIDMFGPVSKKNLIGRAGGTSDLGMGIPKDKERHATQAALIQKGGVSKEPAILIKRPEGYDLLEGWHRTIQHFHMYPNGYTGTAYVAVAQGQQGVAEGKVINTYLWHGSRQKIPMLEPRQSLDTGGAAGSNQNAIYATSDPKVAIAMGLTTPGSDTGMFPNDPQMVLFSGKIRKGEYVYLHKLPFNGPDGKPQFVQGGNSREFHSIPGIESIKPIEIKEIPVNKYLNLIRKATPADLTLRKKYMKQQGVAEGSLNEGLAHPIIVVDVQPEYSGMNDGDESAVFPQIINFVNKQTGPVLMFVNAEDQGLSGDSVAGIKEYWNDTVCPEEERYTYDEENDEQVENANCPTINWNRFTIADKGYGYLRSWMDHGIEPSTIIATIREMYAQKVSDTRELQFPAFNRRTTIQSLIQGAIEEMEDDPMSVGWASIGLLKRFNGAYLVGGGREECLREVELLMNAFNIKYKRIDSLVY